VIDPENPAINAIGSDLRVSYNDPTGPATFLAHGVSVPYAGWQDQMQSCAPTLAQALSPYPQYCGVLQGQNEQHATSIYNSFQSRIERHFRSGLYTLWSLTVQKMYTDASDTTQATNTNGTGNQGNNGQFSPFHLFPRAWGLVPDNVPVTTQVAVVYDLPFGAGKKWVNSGGISNVLVGGWQVSPLWRWEYGTPFSFYSSNCNVVPQFREGCVPGLRPGAQIQPHGRNWSNPSSGATYFNKNAFETDFSQFGYTGIGNAVTTVYGPHYQNLDMSFTKDTTITERVHFKLSANFFNTFNNHYLINSQGGNYGGPGVSFVTDVSSSSFGTWNGAVTTPRTIQFAGRIEF
jgi:hypothetical protein